MSRAFKNSLLDEADDLSTGAMNLPASEKLSGADIEQVRLAALNGSNPSISAAGTKTIGTNAAHGGKSNWRLSGADMERFAGDQ